MIVLDGEQCLLGQQEKGKLS